MSGEQALHLGACAFLCAASVLSGWWIIRRRRAGQRIGTALPLLLAASVVPWVSFGVSWMRERPWQLRVERLLATPDARPAVGLAASIPPVLEAMRSRVPVDALAQSRLLADLDDARVRIPNTDFRVSCMALLLGACGTLPADDPLVASLWKAAGIDARSMPMGERVVLQAKAPWSSVLATTIGHPDHPTAYTLGVQLESIEASDGASLRFQREPNDGHRLWISGCGASSATTSAPTQWLGSLESPSMPTGCFATCTVVIERYDYAVGVTPPSIEQLVSSAAVARLSITLRIPIRVAESPAPRIAP